MRYFSASLIALLLAATLLGAAGASTHPHPTPAPTHGPTATAVPPTPTAPATPAPTPTPIASPPASGWHPPTDHEHGAPPPAWVRGSRWAPFTQTGESHNGYKGYFARTANGVESYLITHILTTTGARSHGDHDFQLWILDPAGGLSYWDGKLDFGLPVPLLRSGEDTGERPIILAQGQGCETWYGGAPQFAPFDLGQVICGRWQEFDGTLVGGLGLFRQTDWAVYPDRFDQFPGAAPTLAPYCLVIYGVCRFSFFSEGQEYPGDTTVRGPN